MKRQGWISAVYAPAAVAYVAISLLAAERRDAAFWMGFGFVLLAFAQSFAIALVCAGRRAGAAFPAEISLIAFSVLYVVAALIADIAAARLLRLPAPKLAIWEIAVAAVYAILLIMLFVSKNRIARHNAEANAALRAAEDLRGQYERLKARMARLPEALRLEAVKRTQALADEFRAPDVGAGPEDEALRDRISQALARLESKIDALPETGDFDDLDAAVREVSALAFLRNDEIRRGKSGI